MNCILITRLKNHVLKPILNDLKIKTVLQIKRTLLCTLDRDIGTKRATFKTQYGYSVSVQIIYHKDDHG